MSTRQRDLLFSSEVLFACSVLGQSAMKPSIVQIAVICVLVGFASCQEIHTIDPMIQRFRQGYRIFSDNSLRRVDRCFFDVYNALNSSLVGLLAPFHLVRSNLSQFCSTAKQSNIGQSDKSRVSEICTHFDYSLTFLLGENRRGLESLFPGELTTLSPAAETAMELFTQLELQMTDMWDVYIRNVSCVGPLLRTILPSYEPLIDNICFVNNLTINLLFETFRGTKSNGVLLGTKLTQAIRQAKSCLSSYVGVEDCFDKAVSYFAALD